jgi:sulfite exporter TauE/SafE
MTSCTPGDPFLGTETIGLPVFFLVGLLGGAHCIGMCGPLVATYADRMEAGRRRPGVLTPGDVRQHALFNLGRTASYAVVGGLFGLAGELLFVSMRRVTLLAAEVRAVTGLTIGLLIVGIGLRHATGGWTASLPGTAQLTSAVTSRLLPRIDAWVQDYRILGLGALHCTLPCPLLYPAYLYAFIQGTPLAGAVALGVLGLGTTPSVFLTGTAIGRFDVASRARFNRLLGLAFVVLGYILLQHGLAAVGVDLPALPLPHVPLS